MPFHCPVYRWCRVSEAEPISSVSVYGWGVRATACVQVRDPSMVLWLVVFWTDSPQKEGRPFVGKVVDASRPSSAESTMQISLLLRGVGDEQVGNWNKKKEETHTHNQKRRTCLFFFVFNPRIARLLPCRSVDCVFGWRCFVGGFTRGSSALPRFVGVLPSPLVVDKLFAVHVSLWVGVLTSTQNDQTQYPPWSW